jgi:tRNA(Ile)-lysidine synthase
MSSNTPALENTLDAFLSNHQLLKPGRPTTFVVAYSGGKDSAALLGALNQLKATKYPQLSIVAAYYWHAWRPGEHDMEVIHKACQQHKTPWVVLSPNLTLPKTEAAARDDRYDQLGKLALSLGGATILTAHHQDDQLETILFRLCRGTGIDGLKGIPAIRDHAIDAEQGQCVTIARPFLDVPTVDLIRYVKINKIAFHDDVTNLDTSHSRNFLRHEVIPKLDEAFPQFRHALLGITAQVEDYAKLAQVAIQDYWQRLFDAETETLDYGTLLALRPEIRHAVIRRFLEHAGIHPSPSRLGQVNRFLDGIGRSPQPTSLMSLTANRYLTIYRGKVSIEAPKKTGCDPVSFQAPCAFSVPSLGISVYIEAIPIENRPRSINYKALKPTEAYVNLSNFNHKTFTLRTRQDGDRITPLGMSEPMKLKRLLNNRGISRFDRDNIPLITYEQTVLWAIGVEMNEHIKTKNVPTHYIRIEALNKDKNSNALPETLMELSRHWPGAESTTPSREEDTNALAVDSTETDPSNHPDIGFSPALATLDTDEYTPLEAD